MYVSHINNVVPYLRISFFLNGKIEVSCNYINALYFYQLIFYVI